MIHSALAWSLDHPLLASCVPAILVFLLVLLVRRREPSPSRLASDFEYACAAELAAIGWVANVVGGAGDQGADVLAERDGMRLVLQCKRHAGPVGTQAVQQAHAARAFYAAHLAGVVTTGGYTSGAVALAERAAVRLLRFGELREAYRRVPPWAR